ncbi:IS4 family transposase [Archangium violaceum]|uniref:IS4 family transposase n=1 Tax=Archangium violaceum TaxID=83451 RepID=UPI0037BE47B8
MGNPVCQGFFVQTALVVQTDGAAFGVLGACTWERPAAQRGKAKSRKQRPFEQKESVLWWRALVEAEERVGEPGRLLHIIDAEGDIFELLSRATGEGFQLLVRAGQDRRVEGEGGSCGPPWKGYPWWAAGRCTCRPSQPGPTGWRARHATPRCCCAMPPHAAAPGRQGGQPVRVWGVLVREEAPPQGQKAVEWLLLSNAPIESEEAAWGAVTAYQKRWGIEELHKALKTGCRLEGRQHEAREHLENLLALTLLTSVKLLRLRTLSRTLPDEPADAVLAPAEVQVLQAMAPQLSPRMPLQGALTLRQALLLIAALGGYMANPQKRPPGWLVLWRGYERLRDYVAGFSLAQFLSAAPRLPSVCNPQPRGRGRRGQRDWQRLQLSVVSAQDSLARMHRCGRSVRSGWSATTSQRFSATPHVWVERVHRSEQVRSPSEAPRARSSSSLAS